MISLSHWGMFGRETGVLFGPGGLMEEPSYLGVPVRTVDDLSK